MTICIRAAAEKDLSAILSIERLCQVSPWTLETFNRCFKEKYFSAVAEKEFADQTKQICGFIFMSHVLDEAHILNVAVAQSYQRQGIGQLLINTAHVHAIKCQARIIFLEVRESNIAAKNLYKKIGYKKIGLRENYYETVSGRENAEVLSFELYAL